MVDIKPKKCITCKIKQPISNYPNEEKAVYCASCKLENMVDITTKRGITCKLKQPTFNYPNEERALCCKSCIENMVGIKHNNYSTCTLNQASYHYPNEKHSLYCNDCKKCGMTDVRRKNAHAVIYQHHIENPTRIAHFIPLAYRQKTQNPLNQGLQKS